jgi:hypothetical protein
MPDENRINNASPNPFLDVAKRLFETVAPGGLNDPEKALRDLVPKLRYVVVERTETPTTKQLQVLRCFSEFEQSNLLQTRRTLQSSPIRLGPFPQELAERSFVPLLLASGLNVSLQELTPEEKEKHLDFGS